MTPVAVILRDGRSGLLSWSDLAGRLRAAAGSCASVEHVFLARPAEDATAIEVHAVLFVRGADPHAAVDVAREACRPLIEAGATLVTAVSSSWGHGRS
ncbi:MAG TPA: hypothetical protein VFN43_00590 [Humibacillus sp.]|nr:hypothetical protein [Humibacillus sp.]